ncbi:hypothetical protein Ancab_006664 [Ancistrocladus abbreviatus]
MSTKGHLFFLLSLHVIAGFTAVHAALPARACTQIPDNDPFDRSDFPKDFIFGVGSSAYQFEGAHDVDGKRQSIWDNFTHERPELFLNESGDVAVNFYHLYENDVELLKDMGVNAFRFSISWSRVLPKGKISGGVNEKGVRFYQKLIDLLLKNNIQPFVTLFHWDLPQALYDDYRGFLSPMIINDFRDYADFCFKTFGDKVKYWTTLNEPNLYARFAHDDGIFAPGRCSDFVGDCQYGDSGREPYIAGHHELLCHAAAVDVYRKNYQASQKGVIGITLVADWNIPLDMSYLNRRAAERANDFVNGWFLDPLVYGDYPQTMRDNVGDRLPKFTTEDALLLKKSFDFLGLNYYLSGYAHHMQSYPHPTRYTTDMRVNQTSYDKHGEPIGDPTTIPDFYVYPEGLKDYLMHINAKYQGPPIIITENGLPDNASVVSPKDVLNDQQRVSYHRDHLSCLLESIKGGVNVKGYFAWSFLDDFEFNSAYTVRYGLHYVDRSNKDLPRTPKASATWFKNFLSSSTKVEPGKKQVHEEL